jgi:hypothetical protein
LVGCFTRQVPCEWLLWYEPHKETADTVAMGDLADGTSGIACIPGHFNLEMVAGCIVADTSTNMSTSIKTA